jgi:hypothetical protein
MILTSKGGGGSSQVLSIVKVLAIDLAFASICDMLKGGTPFCSKVAIENKDKFAYDLFFLLGPFPLSNVPFCTCGFLKTTRFVAKHGNCKIDIKLLKVTSHITLPKKKVHSQLTCFCNCNR